AAQAAALNDWKPRPGNISSPTDGFVAPTGVAQTSTSDPWDRDVLQRTTSPDELQARAIDAAALTTDSTDTRRGALTRMIEEHGDAGMASLVLRTTSADYKSGFGELLRNGGNLALLAPEQRQALEFAEPLAQLQRAQATTSDGAGGYLIPTDIEPSVTLTSDGTDNPIWGMARRVQTAASTLRNVGMPNAAWSWDTEGAEVSDDTVTFTATDIPLYSANGFVPVTIEAQRSIAGIMGDVQRALAGGYQDLVGAALATGSGSAQPTGIITALIGSAAEVETAGSGVYALADVYSWINGLAARHRRNSTAMMAFPIISLTRQFDTAGGAALIARLGDGSPDRIMGLPLVENQDMDSTVSAGTEIAVAGNFDHYVVAEGIGTLVEVIPHLMGANQRPIGARGVYAKTRIGADSVLDTAFSLLQVKA
ncbi:MAG: phage major capsid protein, partial [Actinomycetia bacterium]|nr:phage major capsid protein [Actinomycetes bacterium]